MSDKLSRRTSIKIWSKVRFFPLYSQFWVRADPFLISTCNWFKASCWQKISFQKKMNYGLLQIFGWKGSDLLHNIHWKMNSIRFFSNKKVEAIELNSNQTGRLLKDQASVLHPDYHRSSKYLWEFCNPWVIAPILWSSFTHATLILNLRHHLGLPSAEFHTHPKVSWHVKVLCYYIMWWYYVISTGVSQYGTSGYITENTVNKYIWLS